MPHHAHAARHDGDLRTLFAASLGARLLAAAAAVALLWVATLWAIEVL